MLVSLLNEAGYELALVDEPEPLPNILVWAETPNRILYFWKNERAVGGLPCYVQTTGRCRTDTWPAFDVNLGRAGPSPGSRPSPDLPA